VGAIRYRERIRPLVRVSTVIEQLLERFPAFKPTSVSPVEMVVTHEGEYGALARIAGTVKDAPAQRDLGLVFGDDFYALVSGIALVSDHFAELGEMVRLLVMMDSHALGVRRRRFLYTPPPRWQGLSRGGTSEWTPLDFPRNPSLIQVFPANPLPDDPERVLEHMLAEDTETSGFHTEAVNGPQPITSLHGLSGAAWNIVGRSGEGPRTYRDLVVFRDPRYLYSLRLETMREDRQAEREIFLDLVRSAHPIPTPSNPEPREVGVLVDHWAL
jgi:hypothetical protein